MAVRIRLKRMGKIHQPFYRVVVVDGRKKRDGRVIEEIGTYDPNTNPSKIKIVSDRAQYWLGVGAQPSTAVRRLLVLSGDIAKFHGKEDAESRIQVSEKDAEAAAKAIKDAEEAAEKLKAKAAAAKAEAEAEAAKSEAAAGETEKAAEATEAEEA